MDPKTKLRRDHPDFPLLEAGEPSGVQAVMTSLGWLERGETVVSCDRAGDGNMNLTLRVVTDRRSVILKQARPWVEKYDQIEAPWERAEVEAAFYRRVGSIPGVASKMPQLLASDVSSRSLLLEDLGHGSDLTSVYDGFVLTDEHLHQLSSYLRSLHRGTSVERAVDGGKARPEREAVLLNKKMRALNHQHIFVVPFAKDNGLDLESLEPGLADMAGEIRESTRVRSAVDRAATRYLATGPCLLHGDFFPGSWLLVEDRLWVIDPEFTFYGDPEFDVGVALAHLVMSRQPRALVRKWISANQSEVDGGLVACFAATEIMRRILGVAQLPLPAVDGLRSDLLNKARAALLAHNTEPLL